jgi:hypothetical protein
MTTTLAEPSATTIQALPARVDLELYTGDDFVLVLTVTDQNGDPADLTGCVVRAQIRAELAAWEVAGIFAPTIEANRIWLHLTGQVSAGLPQRGVWDARLTDREAQVTTLTAGRVLMTQEVTR